MSLNNTLDEIQSTDDFSSINEKNSSEHDINENINSIENLNLLINNGSRSSIVSNGSLSSIGSIGSRSHGNNLCAWCRINHIPNPVFLKLIYSLELGKSIIQVQESFFNKVPLYTIELESITSIDRIENTVSIDSKRMKLVNNNLVGEIVENNNNLSMNDSLINYSIQNDENQEKILENIQVNNLEENFENRKSELKKLYSINIGAGAKSIQIHYDSEKLRDTWYSEIGRLMILISQNILKYEIAKITSLFQSIPKNTSGNWIGEESPQSAVITEIEYRSQQGPLSPTSISNLSNFSNRQVNAFSAIRDHCISYFNTLRSIPLPVNDTVTPPLANHSNLNRITNWKIDYSTLKLQQKLAEGSFGIVYKGELYSKEVAIKKLKLRDDVLNSQLVEDLIKEAEVLAALRHPNVLLFMGITDPPEMCLVTEFMEQGNILQVLKKQLLNDLQLNSVLLDICYGVHYLHKQKILHLDLKPANILMSKNGILAKVADFGISKIIQNENDKIRDESQEGTLLYMSPELAFDRIMSIASDVYSFGAVLYEILYLREHPSMLQISGGFENDDLISIAFDLIREPWGNDMSPHCPPWWNPVFIDICKNCLHDDPSQRISFPEIITKLLSIKDQNIINPWFIFENTSKTIMNLTKDIEYIKKLSPQYNILEVIQYCLHEFRSPTIHFNALCSLIHVSCLYPNKQNFYLSKAIQALHDIKDRSIEFFEESGDFIYWNMLLDCKNINLNEKKKVLQHAISLCEREKVRTRFIQQGALGMLTYKIDILRKSVNTPLPFVYNSEEFHPKSMFRGEFFHPTLFHDALSLLILLCKSSCITEDKLESEGVIQALVSLYNVESNEKFATNIACNALDALAELLLKFPSISTLCYKHHVDPKLIAAREYLRAISKSPQMILNDRKALSNLASSKKLKHSDSIRSLKRSDSDPDIKFMAHTSPVPQKTLAALKQQLKKQKSKRNSTLTFHEISDVETNFTKLIEEKSDYLELTNKDKNNYIEEKEKEDIYILFWENISNLFEGSEISPSQIEKNLAKYYLQKRKKKTDDGIKFIKGLVQQIDSPKEVVHGLYLGSEWNAANKSKLKSLGITDIINVATKSPCYFEKDFKYYHIIENSESMHGCFLECCNIIDHCLESDRKILIHSTLGTNRSPTYCIAYLMKSKNLDLKEALKYLENRRGIFNIESKYIWQLIQWHSYLVRKSHHKEID